jgi:hypothetical protein
MLEVEPYVLAFSCFLHNLVKSFGLGTVDTSEENRFGSLVMVLKDPNIPFVVFVLDARFPKKSQDNLAQRSSDDVILIDVFLLTVSAILTLAVMEPVFKRIPLRLMNPGPIRLAPKDGGTRY